MKHKFYIFGILIITITVYVNCCRRSGKWLIKEDNYMPADGIVILMGSIADRILQAADLYTQDLAHRLIIVEENMDSYKTLEDRGVSIISNTEQVLSAAIALGIPADSITILPGDATSTQMEAMIIKKYIINKPGMDTILLVSSAPHTRRASMIFTSAFRDYEIPICFLCSPSTYTHFDAEKWWKSKEGIQTVLMEYVKIANFLIVERKKLIR